MIKQSHVTHAFGWAVLAAGVIGFFPNPLIGDPDEALFGANLLHDLVHVVTGVVALAVVYLSSAPEQHSRTYNLTFGTVYAIVAALGFLLFDTMQDLLAVNQPDNLLHVLFAVVLLGVGLAVDVPTGRARREP